MRETKEGGGGIALQFHTLTALIVTVYQPSQISRWKIRQHAAAGMPAVHSDD